MYNSFARRRRTVAAPVLAVTASAACLVPATAPAATSVSPAITVAGSSVLVVGQPLGQATVTASRPDALTGKPVVIGQYTGHAVPWGPFSVNTTVPTAGRPGGDCWQRGALASALTPDLRPGDTVTVTGSGGLLGATPAATAVTVPADARPSSGPIPACAALAPFAQTVVTDAPSRIGRDAIAVTGRTQPLATEVSIAAGDGTTATAPATATPAGDGTWSATIPAEAVARLRDGTLTLTPVVAVPDVSTGAPAHIATAPISMQKDTPGATAGNPPSGAGSTPAGKAPVGRITGLHLAHRLSAPTARRRGITASFLTPADASIVEVQLIRGGTTLYTIVVRARPGTRQTIRLSSPKVRRLLHPGRYTVRLRAGRSRRELGSPVLRAVVIR
ncbi:MAG: hypothetical protein JWO02_452 [Solirubrobacterales bacterium]|nr:hypothetical protein [Solirubrobacterales bacterium]